LSKKRKKRKTRIVPLKESPMWSREKNCEQSPVGGTLKTHELQAVMLVTLQMQTTFFRNKTWIRKWCEEM